MGDTFHCTSCRKLQPEDKRRTRAGNDVCESCLEHIKSNHSKHKAPQK